MTANTRKVFNVITKAVQDGEGDLLSLAKRELSGAEKTLSFAEKKALLSELGNEYPDKAGELAGLSSSILNPMILTWREFETQVANYSEKDNYSCGVFGGLSFPIGTLSFIGARPGRGKTTLLSNIALDSLLQGKKTVFVSDEETGRQIIVRLVLSLTYRGHILQKESAGTEAKNKVANMGSGARGELYKYIRESLKTLPGTALNDDVFSEPLKIVKAWVEGGQLEIVESHDYGFEDLEGCLRTAPEKSVVLIDYVQHLRIPSDAAEATRQVQLQALSARLAACAVAKSLVVISGGQFTRNKDASRTAGQDVFDDCSFRESGDLEQDGHILVGVGRENDTEAPRYFYSVLKNREGKTDEGRNFVLKKDFAFSYMSAELDKEGNRVELPRRESGGKKNANEAGAIAGTLPRNNPGRK